MRGSLAPAWVTVLWCSSCLAADGEPRLTYAVTLIMETGAGESDLPHVTVQDLNDKGEVLASRVDTRGSKQQTALVWRNGAIQDLNRLLDSSFVSAVAINNNSQTLGVYLDQRGERRAFIAQDEEVRMIDPPPGQQILAVRDLNERGQAVIQIAVDGLAHPFIWRAGQFTPIEGLPEGMGSTAERINSRGEVFFNAVTRGRNNIAFLWKDGELLTIAPPERAFGALARDINGHGALLADVEFHLLANVKLHAPEDAPHVWQLGRWKPLAKLADTRVGAQWYISSDFNDQAVAVGTGMGAPAASEGVAIIWIDDTTPVALDTLISRNDPLASSVHLEMGLLINNAGQIVAKGREGRREGLAAYYLLTPQR